jgi:uncharacterized protein
MRKLRPFTLLVKPVSGRCNFRCGYCFYLAVPRTVYPDRTGHKMSHQTLDTLIRRYLAYRFPVSNLAWQGGEPTLAGLDFFQEVVRLEQKHGASGQTVSNGFQTNGWLLDEEWARLFAEYRFLIGLSMDGPPEIHDVYRRSSGQEGTHQRVLDALRLLQRFQVAFNVLCVISRANVHEASRLYNYFRGLGVTHVQFIPCIERDPSTGEVAQFVPEPAAYGDFLSEMFDLWADGDPCHFSVRDFDAILGAYVDGRSSLCLYGPRCDHYFLIEHNGDVYPCDFFCDPEWKLGNINQQSFEELADHPRRKAFAALKSAYSRKCEECPHLSLCHGGCTKDRINGWGDPNRESYLCEAYRLFFAHAGPRMDQLKEQVLRERRQATASQIRRREDVRGRELARMSAGPDTAQGNPRSKIRRNDPCPCGSGKKFKNCCMS